MFKLMYSPYQSSGCWLISLNRCLSYIFFFLSLGDSTVTIQILSNKEMHNPLEVKQKSKGKTMKCKNDTKKSTELTIPNGYGN